MMLARAEPETFLDGRVTQYCGDVRDVLERLPADHFDCVVTSPPYWGLRSYLPDDHAAKQSEVGLERSLGEHIDLMVEIFRDVRRVLKPTGNLWLNYGDCYATAPNGRKAKDIVGDDRTFRDKPFSTIGAIYDPSYEKTPRHGKTQNNGHVSAAHGGRVMAGGFLKEKDLCMVSNRLAIALQMDGWWVRAENVWAKVNPMPDSSGRYRPSTSHEKVWLLSKTGDHYYDYAAVMEPLAASSIARLDQNTAAQRGSDRANGGAKTNGRMKAVRFGGNKGQGKHGSAARRASGNEWQPTDDLRLMRNVWILPTEPFSESHYATMPTSIAERCIKAGCPTGGAVLDPFGGAGTTALVAASLGRSATLIELNPEYCRLARARIEAAFMGKEEGQRHMTRVLGRAAAPGPLFEQVAP